MPRAYTSDEQHRLRTALLDEGLDRFTRMGLGKVSVAELTEAVGIGKGSFYLFFESKEALFLAVLEREEGAWRAALEAELVALERGGDGAALLEHFVGLQAAQLQAHPFLRQLVEPGTVRALVARVSPEVHEAHVQADRDWVGGLAQRWIRAGLLDPSCDPDLLFSLSAAVFALSTTRDLVGARWPDVVATLARALGRELGRRADAHGAAGAHQAS